MENDCIFCKILARTIPATIIAEDDNCIAIQDIHPKAPVHYLIIPKKHIQDVQSVTVDDRHFLADMGMFAQRIAREAGHTAFRLVINSGYDAGQRVFHVHMHYLVGPVKGHW